MTTTVDLLPMAVVEQAMEARRDAIDAADSEPAGREAGALAYLQTLVDADTDKRTLTKVCFSDDDVLMDLAFLSTVQSLAYGNRMEILKVQGTASAVHAAEKRIRVVAKEIEAQRAERALQERREANNRALEGLPPPLTLPEGPRAQRDQLTSALGQVDRVFVQHDQVVRVAQHTERGEMRTTVRPLVAENVPSCIDEVRTVVVETKEGPRRADLPGRVCVDVLRNSPWRGIQRLRGVVGSPILRSDGTVCQEEGYDEASCLFYAPSGSYPEVDEHPTRDDALRALDELLYPVSEYMWAAPELGPAVWVAAILTIIARAGEDWNAPMFLCNANQAGSGKTQLMSAASLIATGETSATTRLPSRAEEVTKTLISLLRNGHRVLFLDNLVGTIGGPEIDAALTGKVTGRVLGSSDMLPGNLPRPTVLATGNNAKIAGDTARRTLVLSLFSHVPDPENLTFSIDFEAFIRKHHRRLHMAALTVLSAWIQAGRPGKHEHSLGSFDTWASIVPPCLRWLGLPDVLQAAGSSDDVEDPDREEFEHFMDLMSEWRRVGGHHGLPHTYTTAPFTASDLADKLNEWVSEGPPSSVSWTSREIAVLLDGMETASGRKVATDKGEVQAYPLGTWVSERRGRVAPGGACIVQKPKSKKSKKPNKYLLWQLEEDLPDGWDREGGGGG